jgi:hypothetical protein
MSWWGVTPYHGGGGYVVADVNTGEKLSYVGID